MSQLLLLLPGVWTRGRWYLWCKHPDHCKPYFILHVISLKKLGFFSVVHLKRWNWMQICLLFIRVLTKSLTESCGPQTIVLVFG
jgi:hypothetical protein